LKLTALALVAICGCALAGCWETTEDSQGNLQSVGLPGAPIWKSSKPPAPITPEQAGFTPEEAAKMGGPVLVLPPDQTTRNTRYRFYQSDNNTCEKDLAKLLADRAASNATGVAPYCTTTPTPPPEKSGGAVF